MTWPATFICEACTYFVKGGAVLGEGECRRLPPQEHAMGTSLLSKYPGTQATSWCGEYLRLVPTEPKQSKEES